MRRNPIQFPHCNHQLDKHLLYPKVIFDWCNPISDDFFLHFKHSYQVQYNVSHETYSIFLMFCFLIINWFWFISKYFHAFRDCFTVTSSWASKITINDVGKTERYLIHGPLARSVKLRVAHAPGMPEMLPRHRGLTIPTCITARASRTCRDACRDRLLCFFWSRRRGKRSRYSRCMRNPHFYLSGKRPIVAHWHNMAT